MAPSKLSQSSGSGTQEGRMTSRHGWSKSSFNKTLDLSSRPSSFPSKELHVSGEGIEELTATTSRHLLGSHFNRSLDNSAEEISPPSQHSEETGPTSKMLRRKIPQSGLLMVPKRLWMQTIPTQDCEIVVVMEPTAKEDTVNWLTTCLRMRVPELMVSVKNHLGVGCFALYITATMDGLVRGGEELKVPKMTKVEYGSGLREFSQAELGLFQGVEESSTFFTTLERQTIVLHLLNSLRAADGDTVGGISFRLGQAIVPKCQMDGIIKQILPLHDHNKLGNLRVTWVQSFFRYQPLEDIKEYFGAKIGIYFAWLGFYTASLTIPALIGLVFWINFWGHDQAKEDKAFLVLAFLNVVWGSMWLEAWKRRSAELTHRWGIQRQTHELLEDPRPLFRGDLEINPVTGRLEPVYPQWKRNLFRYFFTVPLIFACLLLVFIVMFIILQIQEWWDSVIEYRGLPTFFSYGPKFVMAGTISIFDEGYSKIAVWLNDMENFRNEESYHNHLIIKMAAQLAALFLTRQIVGNIKESFIPYFMEQLKLAKLSFELFGALTPSEPMTGQRELVAEKQVEFSNQESIKQETDNLKKDEFQPDTEKKEQRKVWTSPVSRLNSKSRMVNQAEVEANMSTYDDTIEDYLEMFIQFGYVMLFSSAFPLGAACAFINNLIEIRSDAFKLCCVFQRPFGQTARNIGVWQDAMEFMCLLGIMVNCMLIGLSGQVHRMFPEMSTTQTILLIVVLEHAMIAMKYGISYAIPDVPQHIATELAKAEFRRREAFKLLSISNSPPTQENSEQSSPSRSVPLSNLSSMEMEYTEKSVQTDTENLPSAKKIAQETKLSRDLENFLRKTSTDRRSDPYINPSPSVNLGRSVSAGNQVKHFIPKVSKRWNQSLLDNSQTQSLDQGILGPSSSESLPTLSSTATCESKSYLFDFNYDDTEKSYRSSEISTLPEKEATKTDSPHSKSSDSVATSTIQEESIASDTANKEVIVSEESRIHEDKRASSPVRVAESSKNFMSEESLPGSTPLSGSPGETAQVEEKTEDSKVGKKHPSKFLKRAQSFSQVFKKMADKRKKYGETCQDDYSFAIREPIGELALVPLEKLVSIEDLQKQIINEEP